MAADSDARYLIDATFVLTAMELTGYFELSARKVTPIRHRPGSKCKFLAGPQNQVLALHGNLLSTLDTRNGAFLKQRCVPEGLHSIYAFNDAVYGVKRRLYRLNADQSWSKIRVYKPRRICPHGNASSVKDEILVHSVAFAEKSVCILDLEGQLWTCVGAAVRQAHEVEAKKLPLLGGMRKCVKLVAGSGHFLALVVKGDDAANDVANEDRRSCYFETNEKAFPNCADCQSDSKLRLSTTMRLADQQHDDLLALLEGDSTPGRLDSVEVRQRRSASLGPLCTSTPLRSTVAAAESREGLSTISFLSVDRLSYQLGVDEMSADSFSLTATDAALHISDEFVEVWSWGENGSGQLGHGDTANRSEPFPVSALTEHHVVDVAAGTNFSLALSASGEVFAWGQHLQPSSTDGFSASPDILKLGFEQIALSVCAHHSEATILLANYKKSCLVLHCTLEKDTGQRNIHKLAAFEPGRECLGVQLVHDGVLFGTVTRSHEFQECVSFWLAATASCRLLRALARIWQRTHESSKASCAEDAGASAADIFHRLFLATTAAAAGLARLSAGLRRGFLDDANFEPSAALVACLAAEVSQPLAAYFEALCDAVAFGCLATVDLSKQHNDVVSRLCIEYNTESSSLASRLRKLSLKAHEFWTTLRCSAAEAMSIEENEEHKATLRSSAETLKTLLQNSERAMQHALNTKKFWQKFGHEGAFGVLRMPKRRLLLNYEIGPDKEVTRLSFMESGKLSAFFARKPLRVLVFNDIIFVLEKVAYSACLHLVWLKPDPNNELSVTVVDPEEQFTIEFASCEHKNKFMIACESWSAKTPASRKRVGKYEYKIWKGEQIAASYEGSWLEAKPHGKGCLRSAEFVYSGRFANGLYHGFGHLIVTSSASKEKKVALSSFYVGGEAETNDSIEYKGMFHNDELRGLARITYPGGQVYEGYCLGFEPHGFGMKKALFSATLGSWSNGKADGFCVFSSRKFKYSGECKNSLFNGKGTKITLDGVLYGGDWVNSELERGWLHRPARNDESSYIAYVGSFSPNNNVPKKGTLYLASGEQIEGEFYGDIETDEFGVKNASITFNKAPDKVESFIKADSPEEAEFALSARQKWCAMFDIFKGEELGDNCAESALAWHTVVSGLRRGKELRGDVGCSPHLLETVPEYRSAWSLDYYAMVVEYFSAAVSYEAHPLWRLCFGCIDVFHYSYNDFATSPLLRSDATLEIESLVEQTYETLRLLFPSLPRDPYELVPESCVRLGPSNDSSGYLSCSSSFDKASSNFAQTADEVPHPACEFLFAFFFPKVSPVISTIYSLSCAAVDDVYFKRLLYLNALSDVKLLEYFSIPQTLWPIELPNVSDLEKQKLKAVARKKFYESAIFALQQLRTEANPCAKLAVIAKTFEEISRCVSNFAEAGNLHTWNADDLVPVLTYVLVRAQIQHLGAEIRFLNNFTRKFRSGYSDVMFTTLHATYVHVISDRWTA